MRSETTVALPLNREADDPLPAEQDAQPPCRVLVVDDDELVRAQLAKLLTASRYDVELASSGADALRILSTSPCDIVLTDWQMPHMDGLALCRLVRMRSPDQYVYLIMLTIRAAKGDILTGLAAGADDYLVKGASIGEFMARLETGRRITRARISANAPGESIHADPATGVHSLGYLVQHLPRELARSQRYGHALAVVTCNVHGFDKSRTTLEREAGERLLQEFVRGCAEGVRKADWIARTGPDEFMVVLPETKLEGAHCVAWKFRSVFTRVALASARNAHLFTARIAVTAVEAKLDATSAPRIQSLMRAAVARSLGDSYDHVEWSVMDGGPPLGEMAADACAKNALH
jgi:diguanylate cyclase (GGDEF)-like protein